MVHHLPGLGSQGAKGLVQQSEVDRRLLEQTTKLLQRVTFRNPDRRLAVVKTLSLHDHDRPQQVFAREDRIASPPRCCLAKLCLAKLLEIAVNCFENLGMLVQDLADCLVLVAILTYDLVLLLGIIRPKIKNRFGFHSHRYPP